MKKVSLVERGKGIPFKRYRRITGFIVPNTNRWNNGKKKELKDRAINIDLRLG